MLSEIEKNYETFVKRMRPKAKSQKINPGSQSVKLSGKAILDILHCRLDFSSQDDIKKRYGEQ